MKNEDAAKTLMMIGHYQLLDAMEEGRMIEHWAPLVVFALDLASKCEMRGGSGKKLLKWVFDRATSKDIFDGTRGMGWDELMSLGVEDSERLRKAVFENE